MMSILLHFLGWAVHTSFKYRCECTTGNIAQGRGREANIVRGEAECYIYLPREHARVQYFP